MTVDEWLKEHSVVASAVAALAVAVFVLLVFKSSRSAQSARWGSHTGLTGADGNSSTTIFTMLMWTLAVATGATYLLVRCATSDLKLAEVGLDELNPAYLVLLGIPAATLVGAKAVVSAKTNVGTLQKPNDRGGNILRNDFGVIDFVDVQYLVFNGVLWLYVVASIITKTELPNLPDTLLGLTGVSATAFVGAKVATRNTPTIESATVAPVQGQGQGQYILTVRGKNLLKPAEEPAERLAGRVSVGGVSVAGVDWDDDTKITVTLAEDPGLGAAVAVTTAADVTATGSIT